MLALVCVQRNACNHTSTRTHTHALKTYIHTYIHAYVQAVDVRNDPTVGRQANEVIGGIASMVAALKDQGLLEEIVEKGDEQPWHSAIDLCPNVRLPDLDSELFCYIYVFSG